MTATCLPTETDNESKTGQRLCENTPGKVCVRPDRLLEVGWVWGGEGREVGRLCCFVPLSATLGAIYCERRYFHAVHIFA